MYPPLLFLHPDLAESILFYRRVRLPQAYEKAQSFSHYNYSGAMFPWESAFTGMSRRVVGILHFVLPENLGELTREHRCGDLPSNFPNWTS